MSRKYDESLTPEAMMKLLGEQNPMWSVREISEEHLSSLRYNTPVHIWQWIVLGMHLRCPEQHLQPRGPHNPQPESCGCKDCVAAKE